jgi:hypothetical protein
MMTHLKHNYKTSESAVERLVELSHKISSYSIDTDFGGKSNGAAKRQIDELAAELSGAKDNVHRIVENTRQILRNADASLRQADAMAEAAIKEAADKSTSVNISSVGKLHSV